MKVATFAAAAVLCLVSSEALAAPLPVGFDEVSLPSAAATKENEAALALHNAKKFAEAIPRFRRALELSPRYVLPRYNLACALARSGDTASARKELEAVFEVDWLGFRAKADSDADLRAFWLTADGRDLRRTESELERRYSASIVRGLRALAWISKPGADRSEPALLRIGVFDPETRRFVAINARRNESLAAFVAAELPYAVLVTGAPPKMIGGDMAPHVVLKDVTFWDWTTSGKPLATHSLDAALLSARLVVQGERTTLSAYDPNEGLHRKTARGTAAIGGEFSFWPPSSTSQTFADFEELNAKKTRASAPARGTFLGDVELAYHNGYASHALGGGIEVLKGNLTLSSGDVVTLPKGLPSRKPDTSTLSPDGKWAAVAWDTHHCECLGGPTIGAHVVAAIDVSARRVTTIARGTGISAVRFDSKGKLYVQTDHMTDEVAIDPSGAVRKSPLPAGVLLVPPIVEESSVQCCGP